jgi:SAM-dependent methyltransferase
MDDYGPETYGDRIAEIYDDLYDEMFDTDGAVSFLAERARGGRALELGIGTGRVAIPLAQAGVDVHGIDASPAMVEKMRAKPGGAEISVVMGDFADVPVEESYRLIFVAFNTLFALGSQEDQLRCFRNVSDHLDSDGVFVVEAFVPDVTRFARHQNVDATDVGSDRARIDVTRHDPVTQTSRTQHIMITPEGTKMYPVMVRYAYPPEMDLMARMAGLVLKERHENWRGAPFTANSPGHVSVYGKL